MRRVHLFEFNERPGVPVFVRETIVETLGTGLRWSGMGHIAGPTFSEFAKAAGTRSVVDLCSGTGVPASLLIHWLEADGRPTRGGQILGARTPEGRAPGARTPTFYLTDLFPHVESTARVAVAHRDHAIAVDRPVDATAVPATFDHDTRTLFNAFHHFPPPLAKRILADAVGQRKAIFIYEGFPRNPLRLGPSMPFMAASMMTHPLRTRRHWLLKALFIWLLPLVPLAGLWDAFASSMRVHNEAELREMVADLDPNYSWVYREIRYGIGGLATVFWGIPG